MTAKNLEAEKSTECYFPVFRIFFCDVTRNWIRIQLISKLKQLTEALFLLAVNFAKLIINLLLVKADNFVNFVK